MSSARWNPRLKLIAVFAAGMLVGALSMFEVVPADSVRTTDGALADGGGVDGELTEGGVDELAGEDAAAAGGDGAPGGSGTAGGTAGGTTGGAATAGGGRATTARGGGGTAAPARPGLTCTRSGNGGATDRGVTADRINLATTVVDSGPGASFQAEMDDAMEAVVRSVNRAGGICGRLLQITYKDDGWERQRGSGYIRNFIQQGVFAIPVGASSEAIDAVIETGDFDKTQTPVVGSDGLEISQYQRTDGSAQTWVWPVAAATVSSARIMVKEAYERGARKFGVVFDNNYKFGREGADAFKAEVARLPGTVAIGDTCEVRFCKLQNGQNSYSSDVLSFYSDAPDFVGLFLEPGTALTWMTDANTPEPSSLRYGYGGAQPLFTDDFGNKCGSKCHGMQVWTGFKPFIEQYENDPAVRAYVNAMKSSKSDIDYFNQFSQGAYVGMQLFVQALREVGPDLTRARLREVLNRTTLANGLTLQEKVTYSPSTRYANVTMQGFVMQFRGTWGRWRAGPVVTDPRPTAGAG